MKPHGTLLDIFRFSPCTPDPISQPRREEPTAGVGADEPEDEVTRARKPDARANPRKAEHHLDDFCEARHLHHM